MFVPDLRHFLGVPDDAPAPARRMAQHLGSIVKAGTAAEPGLSWVSSIGCTRRPGRKPCPGQIGILRSELPPAIRWECIVCGDEGNHQRLGRIVRGPARCISALCVERRADRTPLGHLPPSKVSTV